jgi:hypothetical protein
VAPGTVVFSVFGGGAVLWSMRMVVLPGGAQRVTLELPEAAPPPPAAEPVQTAPSPRETAAAVSAEPGPRAGGAAPPRDDESLWESPWLWIGVGVVVVGGTVLAIALASGGGDSRERPTVGTLEPGHVKVEL